MKHIFGLGRALSLLCVAASLALATSMAGCSKADNSSSKVTLEVYAAASLKGTFTEIAKNFEAANPGVHVNLNFAGSSSLVEQMTAGAPADVFASADEKNMDKAVAGSLIVGDPTPFVANNLTIAVEPGNPKGITSLKDLTKADVKTVICAAQVPCGNATKKVEQIAGIALTPVSEEENVKSVLSKVTEGQADAGLVYRTDVMASAGKAEAIDFPESDQATNIYPIAQVKNGKQQEMAKKFIAFVLSDESAKIFESAGFARPAR